MIIKGLSYLYTLQMDLEMYNSEEISTKIIELETKVFAQMELIKDLYAIIISQKIIPAEHIKELLGIKTQWFSEQLNPSISLAADYIRAQLSDSGFDQLSETSETDLD